MAFWVPLAMAAAGAIKGHQDEQAAAAQTRRDADAAAAQTQYSPMTGMGAGSFQRTQPKSTMMGGAMKWGMAGAGMQQGMGGGGENMGVDSNMANMGAMKKDVFSNQNQWALNRQQGNGYGNIA